MDDRYVIAMDWIEGTDLEALLDAEGRPGLDPALAIGYLEQAAEALAAPSRSRPTRRARRRQAGQPDPHLVRPDRPRRLRTVLHAHRRPAPGRYGRLRGTRGRGGGQTDRGVGRVLVCRHRAWRCSPAQPPSGGAPSWGAIERERIPALERIVRPNLATDPGRRDASAARLRRQAAAMVGRRPPEGNGHARARRREHRARTNAEDSVNEVARAHRGHCVSPVDDGPLMLAFASAQDGFDAARELAGRFDARVAAVTGEAEPRAGSYRGESASEAARLLELADRGQVLIDDPTAETIDGRLPPEIGLAEVRDTTSPTDPPAWALVAPGLSIPPRAAACPYRGLMAFRSEDGDLFFGREEVVASILDRLLDGGFMAVVGASGSGKSSLVRAGLVPAYRRAREGPVVVMTPGSDPAAELERSLSIGRRPRSWSWTSWRRCSRSVRTKRAGPASSTPLMDLRETSSTSIVVALRADFYGRCANHPRLATALAEHQHLLGPMRIDELRRAIEGPARAAGLPTRGRPGRRDAGRRRGRARRPPAALPRPLRVVGPPGRPGPHPGGLPCGRRCARERSLTRPRRSSWAAVEQEQVLMRGCSSGSPSSARRRRTRAGASRWRS